jgi:hypothetical protein
MSSGRWSHIKNPPAGALHQHRLGLLNEIIGEHLPAHLEEVGNRSTDPDRIALRKQLLQQATDGTLAGAGMDIRKLADTIWVKGRAGWGFSPSAFSRAERSLITAQYLSIEKDLIKTIDEQYDEMVALWTEGGSVGPKPTHPAMVIATVDMSGSMAGANIMHYAMIMGILITRISKLCDSFITFSSKPRLQKINRSGDLIDWMNSMAHGDWGMSTNIDAANDLLLGMLASFPNTCPRHVIISDMQFNQSFSGGTEVERTKQKYAKQGVTYPLTIYWNMNCSSPGFPVTGQTMGTVLVNGVNQGVISSILTGDYKFKIDPKSGAKVVDINPIDKFLENMSHEDFDCVSAILFATKEGPFSNVIDCEYSRQMIEHYRK